MSDLVNDMASQVNPSHYKEPGRMESIDIIEESLGVEGAIAFCLGNALKYIYRWKNKGGATDLAKAEWYLAKASKLASAHGG